MAMACAPWQLHAKVIFVDEVSGELDLRSRHSLIAYLLRESVTRGATVVLCTHLFDGLDEWPTHLVHLRSATAVQSAVELHRAAIVEQGLYQFIYSCMLSQAGGPTRAHACLRERPQDSAVAEQLREGDASAPAIAVAGLRWAYPHAPADSLRDLSFVARAGARVLLVGSNGAGKSSLLRLIGGKHLIRHGAIAVLGHDAFHAYRELGERVALLSSDWQKSLAQLDARASAITFGALARASPRGLWASRVHSHKRAERDYGRTHAAPHWRNPHNNSPVRRAAVSVQRTSTPRSPCAFRSCRALQLVQPMTAGMVAWCLVVVTRVFTACR